MKHKVKTKYILMEKGGHGPGMKDGKPSINSASEEYSVSMVEWIKEIVGD